AELAFFALPVELLDRRPWAGPATTAPVPAPNSAAPNAAATAFRMFILVSSPFSTDVELLAAALGAAVVRSVGVSGVHLVVHVLAHAAVALMGTNGTREVGRRIDGGRAVVSLRPRKATGRHLGAGGGPGLVRVELAVGRAPDHRARAGAQQRGTERGCDCLSHVHVLPRLSRRKLSGRNPSRIGGDDSNTGHGASTKCCGDQPGGRSRSTPPVGEERTPLGEDEGGSFPGRPAGGAA